MKLPHKDTIRALLRQPVVHAVVAIVGILALHTWMQQVNTRLPNAVQDFFTLSVSVFIEAFPFLVLGAVLAAIVAVYVPKEAFWAILPKNMMLRRLVLSLLGFLLPVCECGNVPLSRALMMRGLRPSEAMTFLLAAPILNPITIWSTWVAFSYDGAIVASRVFAALLIANCIGYLLSLHRNQQQFLNDTFRAACSSDEHHHQPKKSEKRSLFAGHFRREMLTLTKMLALGALLAGAVQTFVPRDVLVGIGSDVVLSILTMLLLAFVVSICANVDAFFALSFAGTFTAGSLVSFLVFGPMIDIKMLALLKTTFTARLLLFVSVLVLILSVLAGLVVAYAL